jgi:hypothetical protein
MTTRAQNKKEIEQITRQQERLIKKAASIPIELSKHGDVNLRRIANWFAIVHKISCLELQKLLLISRPLPKRDTGGVIEGNMAVFAETGPEYIVVGNFRVYPTPLVKKGELIVATVDETIKTIMKKAGNA